MLIKNSIFATAYLSYMNQQKYQILIADSGSTKTDWMLVNEQGEQEQIQSLGLNPFILNPEQIDEIILNELLPYSLPDKVHQIFFYGAGCSTQVNQEKIRQVLANYFPSSKIEVSLDLLAAARALCGFEKGAVGILGTGSNSCIYDGKSITDQTICLGHLAGDEGSGNHLGKLWLRLLFYRKAEKELEQKFLEEISKTKREIVRELYASERPNAYLAQFTSFLHRNKNHPQIRELILGSFSEYTENFLLAFKDIKNYKIHFTGSIAFYFQNELKDVLSRYDLESGNFVQKPIQNLIRFHLDNHF